MPIADTADFETAIRHATSDPQLRQVVADMSAAFDVPAPTNCWWEYAHEVMDDQPDYARLLIQAGVKWDAIQKGADDESIS